MGHKCVNDTETLLQINVLTQIFLVQNHLWQQKSQTEKKPIEIDNLFENL